MMTVWSIAPEAREHAKNVTAVANNSPKLMAALSLKPPAARMTLLQPSADGEL
jgi:hypothetical protein